jgi:hypothetical protein
LRGTVFERVPRSRTTEQRDHRRAGQELSSVHVNRLTLRLAASVGLLPLAAIAYTLWTTPFMTPLILVPGLGCFAFAIWGFMLSARERG